MLTTGRLALFFLLFNEKYLRVTWILYSGLGRFESHVVFSFVNGKGQAGFYSIIEFFIFFISSFFIFSSEFKILSYFLWLFGHHSSQKVFIPPFQIILPSWVPPF